MDNFSCGISRVSLYSQIKHYNITCVICIISAWRVHCTIPQINVAQQAFWGFYIPTKISTHTIHTLSLHTHDVSTHPTFFTNQTTWLTCDWQSSSETLAQCAADISTTWSQQPEAIELMPGYGNSRSTHNLYPSHKLYQDNNCCKLHPPPSPLTLLRVCFLRGFFFPSKTILTSLLAPLFPVPMVFSMTEAMKRDMSILAHDACRISHVRL